MRYSRSNTIAACSLIQGMVMVVNHLTGWFDRFTKADPATSPGLTELRKQIAKMRLGLMSNQSPHNWDIMKKTLDSASDAVEGLSLSPTISRDIPQQTQNIELLRRTRERILIKILGAIDHSTGQLGAKKPPSVYTSSDLIKAYRQLGIAEEKADILAGEDKRSIEQIVHTHWNRNSEMHARNSGNKPTAMATHTVHFGTHTSTVKRPKMYLPTSHSKT